ncbi:Delta-1-pyrroline-5-carboxylate synthase [Hibiscus syriacus]|uniref:Delta-1-pyrroline-5-carboxylate synthase n=1 Tax=Hibiscus syriacus TaxID=106335 RepID=A0A6A3CSH8_HIBSY|nr:Delta-1-pyrroline-5-carboxylate synthase [Hibiscus syriacus]
MKSEDRRKLLLNIADALEANESLILVENAADISALAKSICVIADMEEPIGRILKKTELADGLILEKTSCPLGVLLIIFESRPDALVQIASLAIRTGNGLLLKGGKEARQSNAILHKIITSVIPESIGDKLIGLVPSREDIPDLLKLDDVIDLVIPRGSNSLVSEIKSSTKIPVLGHGDGVCHVYVDKSANADMAKKIVLDAKIDYPAACNTMYHGSFSLRHWLQQPNWLPTLEATLALDEESVRRVGDDSVGDQQFLVVLRSGSDPQFSGPNRVQVNTSSDSSRFRIATVQVKNSFDSSRFQSVLQVGSAVYSPNKSNGNKIKTEYKAGTISGGSKARDYLLLVLIFGQTGAVTVVVWEV